MGREGFASIPGSWWEPTFCRDEAIAKSTGAQRPGTAAWLAGTRNSVLWLRLLKKRSLAAKQASLCCM